MVTRLAGAVIAMATGALALAYLGFGWPILLIGGPLLVGVTITVLVLVLTERPRALLVERRAAVTGASAWKNAAERGENGGAGLMSGFFEISPQPRTVPEQRSALSSPARPAETRKR
ncbi:hypothetical protein SAMN05216207_1010126 [Pseudonocardia ammonioxydans]|uniref:Uncharacterized protein n=1 Tax=Pseudonocardia ammonioxydans TaxID=260086 RepID=A0A1I4X8V4_PSUAM|nr:hypothetical protein SAMN05216207_1010126 [Pseudonocardia ammonioxydans]